MGIEKRHHEEELENPGAADSMLPRQPRMPAHTSAEGPTCSICGAQLLMGCCNALRPDVVNQDVEAYRQQVAVDVFHSLVHGIRLSMRSDEEAGDLAERLFNLHAELMHRATNAGIIPDQEPK